MSQPNKQPDIGAMRQFEESLRQERVEIMRDGIQKWMEEHEEEQKAVIKEAIDEWLDRQILKFGRFSIWFAISAVAAAVLYLWLLRQTSPKPF